MNSKVITRFAPSPTGFLHIGGLRTALYSWLFARQNKGKFLLRIEDTDQERLVKGSEQDIINTLKWAGLNFDHTPIYQSKRLKVYQKYADQLIKQGQAYYCFCTKQRLDKLRTEQEKNKQAPGYDGHCRNLSAAEIKKNLQAKTPYVIRLKIPERGTIKFQDIVRGKVEFDLSKIDDQILIKSNGYPTYHLANVVDDHEIKVTHVIRGEEWLSSVPKHILLYQAFGWSIPKFAHLPMILNKQKQKLSKREAASSVATFKDDYLPEALLNYLVLLGWNPGDDREVFSLQQLVKEFNLAKVHKAGAIFDQEKLDWLNGQYIKQMPVNDLTKLVLPILKKHYPRLEITNSKSQIPNKFKIQNSKFKTMVALAQERMRKLSEVVELSGFFFTLPDYEPKLLLWKTQKPADLLPILQEIKEKMAKISEKSWKKAKIEAILREIVQNRGLTNGEVFWPFRAVLSGLAQSPGPSEIAEILGKQEVIHRLEQGIKKLNS